MPRLFSILLATLMLTPALRAADPDDPLTAMKQPRTPPPPPPSVPVLSTPSTRPSPPDNSIPRPRPPRVPSLSRITTVDESVEKGLEFLDLWQSSNGSWDRLENPDPIFSNNKAEKAAAARGLDNNDGAIKDLAENETENVADTALSARTMLLAIKTGLHPEFEPKVKKSIVFLCRQVDLWNGDTILVQKRFFDPLHDRTPALKDPRYYDPTVDTYFTLAFLAEARNAVNDLDLEVKTTRATLILIRKMENAQSPEGTWIDDTDPLVNLSTNNDGQMNLVGKSAPAMATNAVAMAPAPEYPANKTNIVPHCEGLRAISIAQRAGFDVNIDTQIRAATYLKTAFNEEKWKTFRNPGHTPLDSILIQTVNSAWYQANQAAQFMLDDAQKRIAAGKTVNQDQLNKIKWYVKYTAENLSHATSLMVDHGNLVAVGPALESLPDNCDAIAQTMSPDIAEKYRITMKSLLMSRQLGDGHFLAGNNDSDRGESTFGTATSTRNLMLLNHKLAATQPAR